MALTKPESKERARRTAFLEVDGYRVLRVWNADVLNNLDGVCETILHAAGKL